MITVEETERDLRVIIPKEAVSPQRLNAWLDWLRLEETAQRSQLTEHEADRLADEIKAEWWKANKARFIRTSDEPQLRHC